MIMIYSFAVFLLCIRSFLFLRFLRGVSFTIDAVGIAGCLATNFLMRTLFEQLQLR